MPNKKSDKSIESVILKPEEIEAFFNSAKAYAKKKGVPEQHLNDFAQDCYVNLQGFFERRSNSHPLYQLIVQAKTETLRIFMQKMKRSPISQYEGSLSLDQTYLATETNKKETSEKLKQLSKIYAETLSPARKALFNLTVEGHSKKEIAKIRNRSIRNIEIYMKKNKDEFREFLRKQGFNVR